MIAESKEITVKAADGGSFSAYMALPKTTPAPAIIVITSIFGTDQEMRDLVDRYAEAGFIGIVPDIFWRIEPGPLSHTDEQQRQRAYARMKAFDVDKGVSDIKSIAEMLTSMKEYNGKFAVAGFCFGGRYAFLSATRLGASAAVAFHGTAIGQELGEARKATCPMSLHFGDNDAAVPMEEVEAIKAALKHNPQAEIFVYPGAQHGYTSPSRPAYDAEATRLSFERAMRVLETLK
jgi:carboxymethylenebutenolidase